jgi:hypothetical protein
MRGPTRLSGTDDVDDLDAGAIRSPFGLSLSKPSPGDSGSEEGPSTGSGRTVGGERWRANGGGRLTRRHPELVLGSRVEAAWPCESFAGRESLAPSWMLKRVQHDGYRGGWRPNAGVPMPPLPDGGSYGRRVLATGTRGWAKRTNRHPELVSGSRVEPAWPCESFAGRESLARSWMLKRVQHDGCKGTGRPNARARVRPPEVGGKLHPARPCQGHPGLGSGRIVTLNLFQGPGWSRHGLREFRRA